MLISSGTFSTAAEFDPACANQADLTLVYDATTGVRLCAPVLDVNGNMLPNDALTKCVVSFGGALVEELNPLPGSVIAFPTPGVVGWSGEVRAWCETAAGAGEVVAVQARFPARAPAGPRLLP